MSQGNRLSSAPTRQVSHAQPSAGGVRHVYVPGVESNASWAHPSPWLRACEPMSMGTRVASIMCSAVTAGETPFALVSALQDALLVYDQALQAVRVFAGVPSSAPDVVFHNLRTHGALLLSSARHSGRTLFVHMRSENPVPLTVRLFTSLEGPISAEPASALLSVGQDGLAMVYVVPNSTVLLQDAHLDPPVVAPVEPEEEYLNWWGFGPGRAVPDPSVPERQRGNL